MRKISPASLKRLNAENLKRLGDDRLAQLLLEVADARAEWKRRLRIELAAAQGVEHLLPEIDKRLTALETSRGRISSRQRRLFIRELDGLRGLVAERLAGLDRAAAFDQLWRILEVAPHTRARLRGLDPSLEDVWLATAEDLGGLMDAVLPNLAAHRLVEATRNGDRGWPQWIDAIFAHAARTVAVGAVTAAKASPQTYPGRDLVLRHLARAAQDPATLASTYTADDRRRPGVAIDIADLFLARDGVEAAGQALRAAAPLILQKGDNFAVLGAAEAIDFDWESAWLRYLDRAGEIDIAQEIRWASFLRTLDPGRLRAFLRPLADFDDVEAEHRAFDHAAQFPAFRAGLRFLVEWPALPEAAKMIELREHEINVTAEEAETWAAKLRTRQPRAAHGLLRKAAARAFARRDFATCDRLTAEAESIDL